MQAGSLLESASAGKARWPELTASELAALAAIVLAFLYIEAYRGFYKVRWRLGVRVRKPRLRSQNWQIL